MIYLNLFQLISTYYSLGFIDGAVGSNHSLLLTDKGELYVCGDNEHGQLGLNTLTTIQFLTKLSFDCQIKKIFAKYNRSFVITENGEVYGCGDNQDHAISNSNQQKLQKLTKVIFPDNIKIATLSIGVRHTIFISQCGKSYGCGYNDCYQAGNFENKNNVRSPTEIRPIYQTQFISASAGYSHTVLLTNKGSILVLGENHILEHTGTFQHWKWDIDPIEAFGSNNIHVINMQYARNVKDISTGLGRGRTVFLTKNGEIYFIKNKVEMVNSINKKMESILFSSEDRYIFLGEDKKIYSYARPKNKSDDDSDSDDSDSDDEDTFVLSNLNIDFDQSSVIKFIFGSDHTILISKDGNAYAFGNNENHQVSPNKTHNITTPIPYIDIDNTEDILVNDKNVNMLVPT